jgi:hypothetical protein
MATVTGQDVADFLGQGDNTELVALAGEHLAIITAMARAYTRSGGFTLTEPNDEVAAVITTATARLLANPEQIDYQVGGTRLGRGFQGWSLAETFVLNRYRKRSA